MYENETNAVNSQIGDTEATFTLDQVISGERSRALRALLFYFMVLWDHCQFVNNMAKDRKPLKALLGASVFLHLTLPPMNSLN